jgi:hypothetical protein
MVESDYEEIVRNALERFGTLYKRREEIDVELLKLRQFMYATINMVPDKDKAKWRAEIDSATRKMTASSVSLADSIRRVFDDHPDYGFTASAIREMLLNAGFDFSSYVSNPLSSISTTLRRMAETGELETREDDLGTTLYIRPDKRPRRKIKKTEIPLP